MTGVRVAETSLSLTWTGAHKVCGAFLGGPLVEVANEHVTRPGPPVLPSYLFPEWERWHARDLMLMAA